MLPLLLLLLLLASRSIADADGGNATTYIVFMDAARMPAVHPTSAHWHAAHLQSLSIDPDRHLLYSYSAATHGFAAALLPDHLPLLRGTPEVLLVVPDAVFHLHTTRSPEFLGLLSPAYQPAIRGLEAASHDVVIGVLDTGVWPESPSFAGGELPPPPAGWKGMCEAGVDFPPSVCGRKLVGARSFSRGLHAARGGLAGTERVFRSARDRDGHGTHTASTAAGAAVANASLLGYAAGTARGMAIGARVAAYKVCWPEGCLASDILAGIDAALADGVGVLSLSLGGGAAPYFSDTVAVGAFGAAAAGVFVSCSAGNSGPSAATVSNSAPWVATVGAGTLDRDFPAYVTVPTGARLAGVSLYAGPSPPRHAMLPLVYGNGRDNASKLCLSGTLDPATVRGKIVLCDRGVTARVEKGAVVKAAGGAGMVLANTAASGEELVADSHLLPAVAVGRSVGDKIREYASRGGRGRPMAMLSFGGTVLGVRPSPVVAAFSSRGPNVVVPEVLKPDMIGPGVNILASWSGVVGPTGLAKDGRRTHFNIISGESPTLSLATSPCTAQIQNFTSCCWYIMFGFTNLLRPQ
jgi:hypothetical protein